MTRWSLAAVEKTASDAASLTAARKLAKPGPWSETGSTDALVWGKCQGSGRTPYQVSVDLAGPVFRCTCPSRKLPCKHALALLLLWARSGGEVGDLGEVAGTTREAPGWAAERAARAAAEAPRKPPDPAARAARQQERIATMTAGLEDHSLWLADLVRGGTAAARRQPWSWWDAAAARLVDAQLPGLAERVRTLASEINRRDDWPDVLLAEAGRWWTATRAWARRDELDDAARGNLRAYLGWAWPREEIRAADAVPGRWQVLGAHRDFDGRLEQQRTWLRSETTGEYVQVLDFAAGPNPLPVPHLTGTVLEVTLARYPGSTPRRALFADEPLPDGRADRLPEPGNLVDAHAALAAVWAGNPWAARAPVVLRGSVSLSEGGRQLVDDDGARVDLLIGSQLEPADPWPLLATTGGHPHTFFGELDESGFRPLSLLTDTGLVAA